MIKNRSLPVFTVFLTAIFLLFISACFTSSNAVRAVNIGGEMEISSGLFYQDEIKGQFAGRGEVELYIPEAAGVESRLVMQGELMEGDGEAEALQSELGIKYSYLRYRRDSGRITLGRQPVSWAYGAMINPFDFGFGIEDVAEETVTPEIDGARYFYSLGEGRSLQLVAEFEDSYLKPLEDLGYGARLRLPQAGHDLSFNAAYQPLEIIDEDGLENLKEYLEQQKGFENRGEEQEPDPDPGEMLDDVFVEDSLIRAGATYSGDLGPAGIYGALGYYRLEDAEVDDYAAQLGMDYSWQIGPRYDQRTVFFQAEYLRFLKQNLGAEFFMQMAEDMFMTNGEEVFTNGEGEIPSGSLSMDVEKMLEDLQEFADLNIFDLFVASLTVEIDPFSQAGAALIGETGEGLMALAPFYLSELGGGLELRVQGSAIYDHADDVSAGVTAGLSYYF